MFKIYVIDSKKNTVFIKKEDLKSQAIVAAKRLLYEYEDCTILVFEISEELILTLES